MANSPGVMGAISDAVDAVKSYASAVKNDPSPSVSGNRQEQSALADTEKGEVHDDAACDRGFCNTGSH